MCFIILYVFYREFCERIILCNSLVWSCALSGKSNMTFQEALACEESARKMLKEFPMEVGLNVICVICISVVIRTRSNILTIID